MSAAGSNRQIYVPTPFGSGHWKAYVVNTAFLAVPLLIMIAAVAQRSTLGGGIRPSWSLAALAIVWSAMSVTVFRMVIRHRHATTITLSHRGIQYCAPQIGIIPAKVVEARYGDIIHMAPLDSRHTNLIVVQTRDGVFTFDRQKMAELTTLGATGSANRNRHDNDLYTEIRQRLERFAATQLSYE